MKRKNYIQPATEVVMMHMENLMVEERLLMMALLTFAAVPAYRIKTVLYVTTKKVCQDFWHTFLVINNRCFPAVLSVHFSRIFARVSLLYRD